MSAPSSILRNRHTHYIASTIDRYKNSTKPIFLCVCYSRVVKHYQPPTRVAFEIGLRKKQNACFKAVNVPHVICRMHLERRMTIHRWPKE